MVKTRMIPQLFISERYRLVTDRRTDGADCRTKSRDKILCKPKQLILTINMRAVTS